MFHGQAEMTIGEFEQATGLTGLIDPNTGALNESRLPDIAQFLNRILNMKIAEQDKVFRMFSYRHDIKVAEAIRRGTLDEGMQTIRAKRTEKIQEQTVYRDSKTKAETKYVEVELTHDAKRLDYATSRTYADNGYVRNIKSGRVWALGKQKSKTDTSTGEVKLSYVAIGTNYNYHSIPVDETNDPTKYEKIPKDKAQKPWEDEYDSMPAEVKERVHMVTGAILPIWDRLPAEGQKVYRLNVEGRNIIGRVIPRQYLDTTLKSLGATASKTEYKAPDIFANVLHRGYKYRLSNDWRIERRKVAGDYRIELIGPYYTHMGELRKYGIFEERISYQTRYFIPTNKETGTKAIEEIISSRPVTDEEIPHGAKAGEITEKDIEAGVIAYSVRDLHRRGLLKVAKIDDVKKFFPGQEVGLDANKNIYVKTRGGKYVTLYRVDHIEPNAVVILAGYGKTKFAPGSVIPGAFGQKSTGGYYIKLHRTFGDTWTLAHESMHFMETAGIINERDVEVLKAHIRNLHRDGRWDPANRKDIGGPEDRANFIADRLAIPEQRGPIGRIILRIRAFIDGILETFGVRSPESILRGIESGRVFERTGREGRTAEAYAPAIIPKSLAPMVDSITQPGILQRAWDEFRYQAQDKFHFLNKAQMEAARRTRSELPESQDAYLAETRYHGMAAAAIEDFDEKHVDPLIELMSEHDISVEQADEYLHARHAREANARLREINPDREDNQALSGMSDQEAEQILDRINRGPQAQVYKRIGRMVDAITKARRDLLIEAGLETEDTIAKWEKTYQHYVPLMREGKGEAMPRKGRGFEVRGGQKLRAGSTREVVNILANVVAQHEATIVRAEKAKVSRAFLEFAKAHRGPWKIDVPEKTASFDEDGLIVYRANPLGYMLADNVLAVRVDGKDHHVTFDERDLDGMKILSALKNLDAADMGAVTRAVAKISRWLAVINTSLNPEFIISNFARDIQTAAYNMADNEADAIRMKAIKQVGSAFKGIREYQDNNRDTEWARWFNRFRNAGGQTGWIQSYETIQDREKALISKIEDMKHGKIRSVKRGLTAAFDYIADMNTAVENAIRLSVFKNLIEANVPESKAAKIAKELTVNFNRKGNMGPVLNAFYLFYNASIQGSARLIMAGAKSRKVRKLMGATIVFAAALDIMNRAVGGDDDDGENRYDKIAPWIKDRNMIIMLPGNGGHIQIPLPWGYNIFHVMGQAAGEVLTKKNNKATASALRVGGAIVSAFNPMGGESSLLQMISPTLLDPFVQWAENKDWSGRKLRPSANPYAEKPSSQTYWHSARVPSKWIAKTLNELTGGDEVRPGKIDISPESIDLAIDTVTGGAGKFVSNLISTPIKYAKGEDVETYEIPFLRRVYGKAGKQVLTQEYYENMDSVRLVQRQLSHYKNDPAKVREIAQEYKSEVRLIGRMKATQKAMKDLKDQLKAAENIKDPAVRKAREKKIDEVMQKIMTGFNKNYNLMKNRED